MSRVEMKGTVTPVGSLFDADEARKAAMHVQEAISHRRKDLDRLLGFKSDNSDLIALVQRLPEGLSHEIMVPFGSAAFFPGRMIHTNEFLVLLGEGYYADRTAKQTVEILQRRGKALDSQLESLKATILDLEAETKFFNSTATEAAEGFVEIREECIEEPQKNEIDLGLSDSTSLGSSIADDKKIIAEDAEYARIMSRLDEIENGELEVENTSDNDEDEYDEADSNSNNYVEEMESGILMKEKSKGPSVHESKDYDTSSSAATKTSGITMITEPRMQFTAKDDLYKSNMEKSNIKEKLPLPEEPMKNIRELSSPKIEDSFDSVGTQASKMNFGGRKSFTGSIVEHLYGLSPDPTSKSSTSDQPSSSKPMKPVSRFKLQKGNR